MSEFDPTLITVYTYLQAISCFILAMMFAALLVRNAKTFKFPFVTMIASLLFVANLGFILQVIGYDMFVLLITSDGTNKQKSERFWIQWAGVFSGAHDLAFNCAHWTFSFEYYKIARSMPFALRGVALPHRMVVCQWTLNLVFMTLNILVPLFSSICDSVLIALFAKSFNQNVDTEGWTKAGIVFHLLVGLLQVISGLFLGYAIIKIRQFLGKGLSST